MIAVFVLAVAIVLAAVVLPSEPAGRHRSPRVRRLRRLDSYSLDDESAWEMVRADDGSPWIMVRIGDKARMVSV